jgi:hypothetical protein
MQVRPTDGRALMRILIMMSIHLMLAKVGLLWRGVHGRLWVRWWRLEWWCESRLHPRLRTHEGG